MPFSSMAGKVRLPYLLVSIAAHLGLLAAVFYAGPYSIKAATLDRHARKAEEADIRRRVDEIAQIKTLLEKSRHEDARLLKIPQQQALRALPPPARKPAVPAPAQAVGTRQALAELREHQQLARAALLRRDRQLQQAAGGVRGDRRRRQGRQSGHGRGGQGRSSRRGRAERGPYRHPRIYRTERHAWE